MEGHTRLSVGMTPFVRLAVAAVTVVALHASAWAEEDHVISLVCACREDNDLYQVLLRGGAFLSRYDSPDRAVAAAQEGAGALILADGYPDAPTQVAPALFDAAAKKGLRLYIEFPLRLPGLELGEPQGVQWERAVVSSNAFGPAMERLRILAIHGCRFLPVRNVQPHILMARVAGFDTAVYGLPNETFPILFEHPGRNILVATTKLSQFVTARYAPADAWKSLWTTILRWLSPSGTMPNLDWTPVVRASYPPQADLPADVEARAFRRGVQWFFNARLFPHSSWPDDRAAYRDRVGPGPEPEWPLGDGGRGMLEGFTSSICHDGSQPMRWWLRNDCMGEAVMALAFDAALSKDARSRNVAGNLGDFIFFNSGITKGPRDDPASASFGLMSWNLNGDTGVFYGDDNARSLLGALAGAALLNTDRWDEKILRCLLANLRTTGPFGFRGARIDEGPLHQNGWQHYFRTPTVHYAPHYEAYLWACLLWAHRQTGYPLFLDRPKRAIRMTMDAYPGEWQWTNGLQQERARMLLPLAWLVRVEDTAEHREWLRRVAADLLARQDACGAIREELGASGKGAYAPPASNAAYGTNEAPLIQTNGDPLCDLLYTTNFAFLGLHEAAAATGDALYADAEEKLAKFLCRIQIRSETHPELDGGWFRAFDFRRWECWASNADLGWGAWSIESGWTCAWINAVLAMRQMNTSLWDLTADSAIERHFGLLHDLMCSELADAPEGTQNEVTDSNAAR